MLAFMLYFLIIPNRPTGQTMSKAFLKSWASCQLVLLWFSVACFGVRVSVTFHLTCVHIISSPEPKAHRWAYSIPMVRRPSSVRRPSVGVCSHCSNIFFSETVGPIKAKFYVEPPWVGGTIFCSRHLGHMTKMAATPIYGKNPSKIFFSRTGGPIS